MSAKCINTNRGMKIIRFRESLTDTTILFHLGTMKAEEAANTR